MTETPWQPWMDVKRAEDAYYFVRSSIFQSGTWSEQMRLALTDTRGAATVMRMLRERPVDSTMDLIDPVFAAATSALADVALAREVLDRLDSGWLFGALRPMLRQRFDTAAATDEDYRRVAELLRALDQTFHLNELLERAEQSTDPLVRSVASDFRAAP